MIEVTCYEPAQAHNALNRVIWPMLKAQTTAGRRMVLTLDEPKRSTKENSMLHAMLGYISNTHEWAGKKRDTDTWKRLMVAAWCRARNEQVEILPAVDGHGVDIVFRKTSKLTRSECSDLIEFIFSWGASHDIQFPDPKAIEYVDTDTGEIKEAS